MQPKNEWHIGGVVGRGHQLEAIRETPKPFRALQREDEAPLYALPRLARLSPDSGRDLIDVPRRQRRAGLDLDQIAVLVPRLDSDAIVAEVADHLPVPLLRPGEMGNQDRPELVLG